MAELFEARKPKDPAIMSEIDGKVSFGKDYKNKRRLIITSIDEKDTFEILIPRSKYLSVQEGDFVKRGDILVEGTPVPHDILRILGVEELAKYLVREVQTVYKLQGVYINDKHIEVIARQMLQKVLIKDSGDSTLLVGEHIHKNTLIEINKNLEDQGVIFLGMDDALKEHEELVKEYFSTIIPPTDNKFAALNSAVWSGGSFIYVPPGVHVEMPLQAYFRINSSNAGQFERTLIIVDEGASVHYVEGCTAPTYTTESLHSAVVEIVIKKDARCRYTTIQNWSNNVYNLVTKRAAAYKNAVMEWVDGNLGSKLTMKYPSVYLMEEGAHGEVLSIAFAGAGQHQDAGGKIVHGAPNTTSKIISKSISRNGGRSTYRGLLKVYEGCSGSRSNVVCDALLIDDASRSDTYPYIEIDEDDVSIGHEASVSKVGEDQLFYLMSRGLSEEEASSMVVSGFIEPLVKELPMEYAVEMNRLIQLQMEGSIG